MDKDSAAQHDDDWEKELEKRLDIKNFAASAVPI